ncbi:MAG: methyltransferase, partial [Pseudomonadota bacterium]
MTDISSDSVTEETTTPIAPASLPKGAMRKSGRFTRLLASRRFQKWAAKFPLTRRFVKTEGEAMFDLVAGFCHSQVLQAFIRLNMHQKLLSHEMTAEALADECEVPIEGMLVLLHAAQAIGLIKMRKSGRYALTRRGAALAGVPGLAGMIDHHDVLYLDLADPVEFFRGQVDTELAEFWPYVLSGGNLSDAKSAETYSALMEDSQALVAEDTLAVVGLSDVRQFMDVGGGTGAFLRAVGAEYPHIDLMLFDLPRVSAIAQTKFEDAGLDDKVLKQQIALIQSMT